VERFIALARPLRGVHHRRRHRRDETHLREVEAYWRSRGVDPSSGMASSIAAAACASPPPRCPHLAGRPRRGRAAADLPGAILPSLHGWDGRYYLCSQDWRKKEVAFGSVFETSFAEITAAKLTRVSSRKPSARAARSIPRTCCAGAGTSPTPPVEPPRRQRRG
jgi:hypothetical protein